MRPVRRGPSPRSTDYPDYKQSKPDLECRLGTYCSYCERRIPEMLAVEHIQAKSLHPNLEARWENFLLACTTYNAIKGCKDPPLDAILLPDRDNTFVAFRYSPDGFVAPALSAPLSLLAQKILELTGLERPDTARVRQRMEAWAIAMEAMRDVVANPDNQAVKRQVVSAALGHGFFSIWLTIFSQDADMCNRLVDAFPGTRDSGCFDSTAKPVTPAPNPDALPHGARC